MRSSRILTCLVLMLGCEPSPSPPPTSPRPSQAPRPADTPPAVTSAATLVAPPPTTSSEIPAPPPDRPRPPGFVDVPFETETPMPCGPFRVLNDASSDAPNVRVLDEGGRVVYRAQGRVYDIDGDKARMSISAEACGDLTGDGVPELVLAESTGGAHCCHTYYVVSLTRPAKRLLMWEKGDGGHGLQPVRFGDGGAWQLLSWAMVTPPFDPDAGDPVMSYAWMPFYPVLFELSGNGYAKKTFARPAWVAKIRDEERAICSSHPQSCRMDEVMEWGMALIIGDWEQQKGRVVPDEPLRQRLDIHVPEMRKRLRAELGP